MAIRYLTRHAAALGGVVAGLALFAGCEPESPTVNTQLATAAQDAAETEADRALTLRIRQALMGDQQMSSKAKNIVIVSRNGTVTLRGTLDNKTEKTAVIAAANIITGPNKVIDELTVTM